MNTPANSEPAQPLAVPLSDQLGQTVARLRERGNAMRCHPVANGTISHTEAAGELLCDVASLIEKLAAERERWQAEVSRLQDLAVCSCGDEFTKDSPGTCWVCKSL